MSNSSEVSLVHLPIAAQPSLAARFAAAEAALTLAGVSELEGNTSRREWLNRGLVELAGCRAAMLTASEPIGEQVRLIELQRRASTILEELGTGHL